MPYSNPEIPEGINTTYTNPLREFAVLAGTTLAIILTVIAVVAFLAERLAPLVPLGFEQSLTRQHEDQLFAAPAAGSVDAAKTLYLQTLADDLLAQSQHADDDIRVTIHFAPAAVDNAFAAIGGHVIIYDGLLRRMADEPSLAFVLVHEIAHVQYRDPIVSATPALSIFAVLKLVSGTLDIGALEQALGVSGQAALLAYSREQESRSDLVATEMLYAYYGTAYGATHLLKALKQSTVGDAEPATFFATHPLHANRISDIETYALERGWQLVDKAIPIPFDE